MRLKLSRRSGQESHRQNSLMTSICAHTLEGRFLGECQCSSLEQVLCVYQQHIGNMTTVKSK